MNTTRGAAEVCTFHFISVAELCMMYIHREANLVVPSAHERSIKSHA